MTEETTENLQALQNIKSFTTVPVQVTTSTVLSENAKHLYIISWGLTANQHKNKRNISVSIQTMTIWIQKSHRRVYEAIKDLLNIGLFVRTKERGKKAVYEIPNPTKEILQKCDPLVGRTQIKLPEYI